VKSIRSLLIVSVLASCITGPANAGDESAENVLNAIRILSQVGSSDLNDRQSLSKKEAKFFRNSYCSAYDLGKDYRLKTLRKKLGNDFGTRWRNTVPALKVICTHWRAFATGNSYRASRNELVNVEKAMRELERFRVFYVAWLNS
jgi:hypothetical protein